MKTLNEYLALPYRMEIVEDRDEGGFVVSYPDLPGCITCGETVESAVANALDAKRAWLEAALEDGIPIREPDDLESYSGQFKLRIPKSLHKSLTEQAKREGISMSVYLRQGKPLWRILPLLIEFITADKILIIIRCIAMII